MSFIISSLAIKSVEVPRRDMLFYSIKIRVLVCLFDLFYSIFLSAVSLGIEKNLFQARNDASVFTS